jgi:hypothetical protein
VFCSRAIVVVWRMMSLRNSSSARAIEKGKDRRRQGECEMKVNSKEISQNRSRSDKKTKRKEPMTHR